MAPAAAVEAGGTPSRSASTMSRNLDVQVGESGGVVARGTVRGWEGDDDGEVIRRESGEAGPGGRDGEVRRGDGDIRRGGRLVRG